MTALKLYFFYIYIYICTGIQYETILSFQIQLYENFFQERKIGQHTATFLSSPPEMPRRLVTRDDARL